MHILRNNQLSDEVKLVFNSTRVIIRAETGMVISGEGIISVNEGSFSMVCIGENPSGLTR